MAEEMRKARDEAQADPALGTGWHAEAVDYFLVSCHTGEVKLATGYRAPAPPPSVKPMSEALTPDYRVLIVNDHRVLNNKLASNGWLVFATLDEVLTYLEGWTAKARRHLGNAYSYMKANAGQLGRP